jgi:ABC-type phosphate transport system auxiliary subunit
MMLEKRVDHDLLEEAKIEKTVDDLKNEIKKQAIEIHDVTKERDDLMERISGMQNQVKQMTMNAKNMKADEFEDTFEAVMREEFDAMRGAYESKLKVIKDEVNKIRYEARKEMKEKSETTRIKMIGLKSEIMKLNAHIKILMSQEI